jgi:hypothetical protein
MPQIVMQDDSPLGRDENKCRVYRECQERKSQERKSQLTAAPNKQQFFIIGSWKFVTQQHVLTLSIISHIVLWQKQLSHTITVLPAQTSSCYL